MKIGVLSDTHNYLDPQIPPLLAGCEHILHAGDIGLPSILGQLETVAPVTAVLGNTDDPRFGYDLTRGVELEGLKVLVHHIVNPRVLMAPVPDAHQPEDSFRARVARDKPDLVVFGHTHKPFFETINGIAFLNPGYAGKPRFGMERSIAILHSQGNSVRPEYIRLP